MATPEGPEANIQASGKCLDGWAKEEYDAGRALQARNRGRLPRQGSSWQWSAVTTYYQHPQWGRQVSTWQGGWQNRFEAAWQSSGGDEGPGERLGGW